jgi:hypothetical protein
MKLTQIHVKGLHQFDQSLSGDSDVYEVHLGPSNEPKSKHKI